MGENNARRTFARFFPPALLIAIGLIGMQVTTTIDGVAPHEINTMGFGLFTIGAFAFIIIINHARNQLLEKEELVAVAQTLVVYGGLATVAAYEQVFTMQTLAMTICIIFAIGTLAAIVTDLTSLERTDIVSI